MTAPVLSEQQGSADGVEVAMTAPVLTEADGERWRVAFVLPSRFTPETAPLPTDPLVKLSTVPSKTVAVVRFSGLANEWRYRDYEAELLRWIERNELTPASEPRYAGYDPPWTLPFRRRNEVLIDLQGAS